MNPWPDEPESSAISSVFGRDPPPHTAANANRIPPHVRIPNQMPTHPQVPPPQFHPVPQQPQFHPAPPQPQFHTVPQVPQGQPPPPNSQFFPPPPNPFVQPQFASQNPHFVPVPPRSSFNPVPPPQFNPVPPPQFDQTSQSFHPTQPTFQQPFFQPQQSSFQTQPQFFRHNSPIPQPTTFRRESQRETEGIQVFETVYVGNT
ncbi:uncharacterized protein MELLADRAFT_109684 [Melampsora larici-populina 98AG31]|uniref:Uncharacterized protein n=1 Tax=Melampsora larici-populina (strain 98AG31 / pathotype 3-4-7) TaxID=747676 RepID=F4RXA4_MELLP|nr:uncharacterized protein MELLADRAFT_109684 [Melampsora larici-populina 98AG31]EGG02932.1 hypothetical protein MELLADRAFT_109684 [Melampsora larici-populina 98AG31]